VLRSWVVRLFVVCRDVGWWDDRGFVSVQRRRRSLIPAQTYPRVVAALQPLGWN